MALPTREEAQQLAVDELAAADNALVDSAQVHATIALAWATLANSLPAAGNTGRDRPFNEAANR